MTLLRFVKTIKPSRRAALWSFFGGLLLLGALLLRDYGYSIDEMTDRKTGMITLKYLSEKVYPAFVTHHADFANFPEQLSAYPDRFYGVAFQLPVTWLEQVLNLSSWRAVYLLRHWCTFLISLGGVAALYQLARRRFGSWQLGLLAATLLVLSPRMFAESFYNDKDIVFMAFFTLGMNTTVAFVARPTWRRAGWHALACALAIDTRVMGVLLPAATGALLGLQLLKGAYPSWRRVLVVASGYGLLLAVLATAAWPYLWSAPLANFLAAYKHMAQYQWMGEVLYQGHLTYSGDLPWHYAPVWISITTPLLYLAGFGVGTVVILGQLLRRHWRLYATTAEWQDLFFLGLVLAPLAAVIWLHSVLYDGWRQLYFVYPALLLVALRGLVAVARWQPLAQRPQLWTRACQLVLAISLLGTAGQMVALHPLQNVYFNALAGPDLARRYEVDYWMLSYNQGLRWIAEHDKRTFIKVAAQMTPVLEANRWLLPEAERNRFQVMEEPQQADYYMSTYRYNPELYPNYPYEATVIKRQGTRVLAIFRLAW